jgi:fatty-acyl-CoA synthase
MAPATTDTSGRTSITTRRSTLAGRYPTWTPLTIDGLLDRAAQEFPERPYLITDQQQWTYQQLQEWSQRMAAGLRELGVQKGDHVAIVMANFPEFVATKYAIARAGATCIPINFLNRRDELGYVLRQSDAKVLITMDKFRDLNYLKMLDELAPHWEDTAGGDAFPMLKNVIVFSPTTEYRDGVQTLETLSSHDPWKGYENPDPNSVSDILYTSGTTGSPKGVMVTHDQYTRAAYGSAYCRGFDDGWRVTYSLPMYHVFGYAEGMLTVPFVGGAIVPQLVFDPAATLRSIEQHQCDDILLVPTMTRLVLDELQRTQQNYDLSSLRAVISSGQRSSAGTFELIFELMQPDEVTTGYGMTEVTATTTCTRPEDPRDVLYTQGVIREVGRSGDQSLGGILVDYRVVDPQTGDVLGAGKVGELRAKGPGVTQGYYNKPEENAAAFDDEGWFCSGDLGSFDDKGYLTLSGRLKETYRVGGEQVMPTEIEDLLNRHPDVAQAHVVPVPDDRMGEVGAAWIVLRKGAATTTDELHSLCAENLARFKVPKYVLFIDADDLPTTPSGRAQKFLLSERAIMQLELK